MSEISRLRWLCRRGMKELDVVMTGYLDNYYRDAVEADQQSFKILLEMPDPDLFALLVGRDSTDDANLVSLLITLRKLVSNR
ncbi:MAG: succinate dehydrogenase assembly factor 2 [Gammaproteobacteria bacterium]|nr:succinate dehydrogenase assembly factor 2 [Gammaproteobacteria bacterium]